jgi:hypothetical protein
MALAAEATISQHEARSLFSITETTKQSSSTAVCILAFNVIKSKGKTILVTGPGGPAA